MVVRYRVTVLCISSHEKTYCGSDSFNLWTLALFHDHWEQVQAHLIDMGQEELVKWVKEHVLFWNSKAKKWDAH